MATIAKLLPNSKTRACVPIFLNRLLLLVWHSSTLIDIMRRFTGKWTVQTATDTKCDRVNSDIGRRKLLQALPAILTSLRRSKPTPKQVPNLYPIGQPVRSWFADPEGLDWEDLAIAGYCQTFADRQWHYLLASPKSSVQAQMNEIGLTISVDELKLYSPSCLASYNAEWVKRGRPIYYKALFTTWNISC